MYLRTRAEQFAWCAGAGSLSVHRILTGDRDRQVYVRNGGGGGIPNLAILWGIQVLSINFRGVSCQSFQSQGDRGRLKVKNYHDKI